MCSEVNTTLHGYDPETDTSVTVNCGSGDTKEFEMLCQEGEVWDKTMELGVEKPIWNTFGFSYVFIKEQIYESFDFSLLPSSCPLCPHAVGHIYIKHKRKRQKPKLELG